MAERHASGRNRPGAGRQALAGSPLTPYVRAGFFVALAAISWLSVSPASPPSAAQFSDKLNHVVAFLVLAGLLDLGYPRRAFGLDRAAGLLAYGLLIEGVQRMLPWREFSLLDLAADALGVLVWWLIRSLPPVRRRIRRALDGPPAAAD